MVTMEIELLHIEDCPNWRDTGDRIMQVLAQLGAPETLVRFTLLASPEEAERVPFAGSPTVLIDGVDAFPSDGQTRDLACRIYFVDGRFAASPSADNLRLVISKALAARRSSPSVN